MGTYYVDNGSSGSQYYFNQNTTNNTQSYRNQASPVTFSTTFDASGYSSYPTSHLSPSRSAYQTIRVAQDDSYRLPEQHQSVAGFNKNTTTHHYYQTSSLPTSQPRARVLSVGHQDSSRSTHQPVYVAPQQLHIQYDPHQQTGHSTAAPVVYQTPGASQFTHRNVDLWTESPNRGADHYVQVRS